MLASAALPAALPASNVEPPGTFPLSEVHRGVRAEVVTVLTGTEPERLEVELLGVLDDWLGPNLPIVLGRFTGEKGKWIGVAAGMSGSPVMVGDRLLGALSYSVGSFTREPICGITPIGIMLDLNELPAGPAPWRAPSAETATAAADLRPIPAALSVRGVDSAALDDLEDLWPEFGGAVARPAAGAGAAPALGAEDLQPGRPITALLLWGDKQVGATGTVTWRDGDHWLAFGHPFLASGRAEAPVAPAETVWTVPSEANAFKISRTGEPVGTMNQDRLSAIGGVVGPIPEGLPVTVRVRRPGAAEAETSYQMIRSETFTPVLVSFLLRAAIADQLAAEQDQFLRLRARVELEDHEPLLVDFGGAGSKGGSPSQQVGAELVRVVGRLVRAPMELPRLERMQIEIDAGPRLGALAVASLELDRRHAAPGEVVEARVELKGERGEHERRSIALALPRELLPGSYEVVVGSSRAVVGELGSLPEARRRSAERSEEYLEALDDYGSNMTLEARLVLRAEGIVSGGRHYPALPSSVHDLLRSSAAAPKMYRARWLSLARALQPSERVLAGVVRAVLDIQPEEAH